MNPDHGGYRLLCVWVPRFNTKFEENYRLSSIGLSLSPWKLRNCNSVDQSSWKRHISKRHLIKIGKITKFLNKIEMPRTTKAVKRFIGFIQILKHFDCKNEASNMCCCAMLIIRKNKENLCPGRVWSTSFQYSSNRQQKSHTVPPIKKHITNIVEYSR